MSPHKTDAVLLSRDAFRNAVFARDGHACVICHAPAQDAHHIVERRLWPDGGYFVDNGASVCGEHHIDAESTVLSCDAIRAAAGITRVVLPEHLYADTDYDKWGNVLMPDGTRIRGELFYDESVQRILAPVLHLFERVHVKYPRTFHLPWSPGVTKDDRIQHDLSAFVGQRVVVTEKFDGENTTMYRDGMHARSLSYEPHPSRARVKALHASIAADIPEWWRVCGENVFAEHSLRYDTLPGVLLVFSIWNDRGTCISWDETVEWASLIGLPTVPVLYDGIWDERAIRALGGKAASAYGIEREGYVVRVASEFPFAAFRRCVAKYVRASHVTTHGHWMRQPLRPSRFSP